MPFRQGAPKEIQPHAESRRKGICVTAHLSDEEEERFLKNVRELECSKSDYMRFAIRLGCSKAIDAERFAKNVLRATAQVAGGRKCSAGARVSDRLYREAGLAAAAANTTFSTWLRAVLIIPLKIADDDEAVEAVDFVRVREVKNELMQLRRDTLRIGQNCNQIAYALNVCKKKNWIPAKDAIGVFDNFQSSLDKIEASLGKIADGASKDIAALGWRNEEIVLADEREEGR